MGSPTTRVDKQPETQGFYQVGKYEVTQAQYEAIIVSMAEQPEPSGGESKLG